MIGGNIPGETRVLSIALFDHVEAFDYARAHMLSIGLLVSSMVILAIIYWLNLTHTDKRLLPKYKQQAEHSIDD